MYSAVEDKRLFWEMLKMEFRSTTISYSENKSKLEGLEGYFQDSGFEQNMVRESGKR